MLAAAVGVSLASPTSTLSSQTFKPQISFTTTTLQKIREAFRDVESVEDVRRNFKVLGFEEVEEHIASMSKHMCPDILQKQESLHFWVEKSDFSLIAEEFLNSFGFNFVIPKIYDILPCNPMFSMMVRGLQRKVYQVATEGLSHDDVCRCATDFLTIITLRGFPDASLFSQFLTSSCWWWCWVLRSAAMVL